jgi:hypothetical protein
MIIIANILIIVTVFTLISFPVIFGILIWQVIEYDGLSKGIIKHKRIEHQINALIIPFGLGLLQYYQRSKNEVILPEIEQQIVFKKNIWMKNFKILILVYPIFIFLSCVLMIYFKYL